MEREGGGRYVVCGVLYMVGFIIDNDWFCGMCGLLCEILLGWLFDRWYGMGE